MTASDLVAFEDGTNTLYASWGVPEGVRDYPLVVLATGDSPKGSRGQTWQQLVPLLLSRGLGTLLFDFSGLGHSPGIYKELTLTLGCKNFRAVMQHVARNGQHDKTRIGVIGASYGGNVALLEASRHPQIKAIGLKSPSTFLPEGYQLQYGPELMEVWGREGYSDVVGLNYDAVIDSLFHNTYLAASTITAQVKIVHGTQDSAVPIRHVRDLLKILPNGSLVEIEGADHWYSNGNEWERMATTLVDFMAATL